MAAKKGAKRGKSKEAKDPERSRKAAPKGPPWTDADVRTGELLALTRAAERWRTYAHNLRTRDAAAGSHEMRVARVLAALCAARGLDDNDLLSELEKAAEAVFGKLYDAGRYYSSRVDFPPSVSPGGTSYSILDPAPQRGARWGRASAVQVILSTIAYWLRRGLSDHELADVLVGLCASELFFFDLFAALGMSLPNWPDARATTRVERQIKRIRQGAVSPDPEALLRAGFRGLGLSAAQARDVLSFKDKRTKRGRSA